MVKLLHRVFSAVLLGLIGGVALALTPPVSAADIHWTPAGLQQAGEADRAVWSIEPAPGHPTTLLIATSGHGVLRSTDGGSTWTAVIPKVDAWLARFDSAHQGVAYAGTASGLFKSLDGGATWSASNQGLTDLDVRALALNNDLIVAGTSHGVFYSRDGAATWTSLGLADLNIAAVAIIPAVGGGVTLLTGADNGAAPGGGYLFRSQDVSASWSSVRLPGDPGVVVALSVAAPTASVATPPVVVGTAAGLFRSDDGGTTWTQVSGLPETDFNSVLFNPANADQLYVASDGDLGNGGVFRSLDRGSSWSPLGFGLPAHPRVTALALQPASPLTVFAATWNPTTQQVGLYHIPDPDATAGSTTVAPKPSSAPASQPIPAVAPSRAASPAVATGAPLPARLAIAVGAVALVVIAVTVILARQFRPS